MKKIVIYIMIMVMLLSSIVINNATIQAETQFSDVKNTDWYYNTIMNLTSKAVIGGYPDGTFKPQGTITVEEFIALVLKTKGVKADPEKTYASWSEPYYEYIRNNNIKVNSNILLQSEKIRPITREEICHIIYLIAKAGELKTDIASYERLLTDSSRLQWYRDECISMFRNGVVTGYPDKSFQPYNNATRAEAATMIERYLETGKRKYPEDPAKVTLTQEQLDGFVVKTSKDGAFKYLIHKDNLGGGVVAADKEIVSKVDITGQFFVLYQYAPNNIYARDYMLNYFFETNFSEETSNWAMNIILGKKDIYDKISSNNEVVSYYGKYKIKIKATISTFEIYVYLR